jgi:hypothetical protein
VLRDVDRRAAIFATERQTLRDAHQDDQDRRGDPDRRVARHHPDPGRRHAHQRDRDQKGVFAPQPVAQIAEQHRAQWPEGEADREGRPGE